MWKQPYRRGIRFFPHIIPIGFPLIFPVGIGLVMGLFHLLFPVLGVLILVALAFFIIRAITLGSPRAAWNSMKGIGGQWPRHFTSQDQQTSYYQPSSSAGQQQSQPYGQYGQSYQPGPYPTYDPAAQSTEYYQPRTQNAEQMPPMQQQ